MFFISSCEEETQSGYDCISNTCTAVFESPQYLTLSDCQSACEDNNGCNIEIGATYQGGLIFYIDETGEHGLVAAMEDLPEAYRWGCYGTDINANDSIVSPELQAIGTGLQNTLEIAAGCIDTNTAAYKALISTTEGYTDWYLPSFDELYEMYNTIGNGGPQSNIGSFQNSIYWSSSEYSDNVAWYVNFNNGDTYTKNKNSTKRVRIIRAF